jgi:hypothetical protein
MQDWNIVYVINLIFKLIGILGHFPSSVILKIFFLKHTTFRKLALLPL